MGKDCEVVLYEYFKVRIRRVFFVEGLGNDDISLEGKED